MLKILPQLLLLVVEFFEKKNAMQNINSKDMYKKVQIFCSVARFGGGMVEKNSVFALANIFPDTVIYYLGDLLLGSTAPRNSRSQAVHFCWEEKSHSTKNSTVNQTFSKTTKALAKFKIIL